ncbi:MAG TPA: DUF5615 family PIN-like protein [Candidatus Norongarragalinales archaeon]|jgi:hypothetical protein|nr:DUF5615 family PIN-like protein [Candidatus Norongarragalinales archaeon]
MAKPRFFCDAMLQKLARYLRVAGYSTMFATSDLSDEQVLELARKSERILLTADKPFFARARHHVPALLLNPRSLSAQLKQLRQAFKISLKLGALPTRCPVCDGKLKKVSKKSLAGKVWPRVLKEQKVFWKCENCGHVYWKGSHWKGLKKTLR